MSGDQVDGVLVVAMILTALLVVGAVSGLIAIAAQHFEAWLDRQLAAKRLAARRALATREPQATTRRRHNSVPRPLEGTRR